MDDWEQQFSEESESILSVDKIQALLADRYRSERDKLRALSILTNMANDESLEVLRWYSVNAEPGMELASALALVEADRLNHPPLFDEEMETLLELVYTASELALEEDELSRASLQKNLATMARAEGWLVETEGRALVKHNGFIAAIVPIEMVVNGRILVSLWDQDDQDRAWLALNREEEEELDPFAHFYTLLRASNLPWGVQIDISGEGILTDVIQNLERDERFGAMEYLLAMG